ncbi:MAG: bifunctional demethylmenaquinone methyltransferase/2-methoxy-6-polyprenyl-1,4-benzoquinol methylase UbiE [Ignavibacteriales bacterium]|nr:bifunctional demethylmenaquinone methyltransferase/2-methoxy-6-polyprenyl-1,4-benzoquinol methylase UbiE [Ignavibacteriales bacterium]
MTVRETIPTERQTYEQSYVRSLFNRIAPHYDFLNHFLSLGFDIQWRKKAVRLLLEYEPRTILDVATGTADLALEVWKPPVEKVYGIDLSPAMLNIAKTKIRRRGLEHSITVEEGSAEQLRFPGDSFDAVMVAFGVRNFSDLHGGLREMYRVLRPGGAVMILEFSRPRRAPFKQLYSFYFTRVLPRLGGAISRSPEAYQYLPSTVQSFPDGDVMLKILGAIGFIGAFHNPLTLGIATIYIAEKPIQ